MQRFIIALLLIFPISTAVIQISSPPSSTISATEPTDPVQCLKLKCPTELNACQNNPMCSPTMYSCVDKCQTDPTCLKTCVYDASLEPTFGVMACSFKHNCFDAVQPVLCLQDLCPDNLNACPNDPECEPTLYKCFDQCKSNAMCWNECIAGTRNYIAIQLTDCGISKQCFSAQPQNPQDPLSCVQKQCEYQLSACHQDPKCEPTLFSCYDKCQGDQICWNQCLAAGANSKTAVDVSNCALDNECFGLEDPISCISQKCPSQYEACGNDPICTPTAEKCFGECTADRTCWGNCLKGGPVQMAVAVTNCAFQNKCFG